MKRAEKIIDDEVLLYAFIRSIEVLGFKKIKKKKVVKDILKKNLKMPKRATPENALQLKYLYKSETGYKVKINLGVIDNRFIKKGSPFVLILDESDDRTWTREFYKTNFEDLFERLLAYAKYAKIIADSRPNGMELVENRKEKEYVYNWVGADGDKNKSFDTTIYIALLDKDTMLYIAKEEARRIDYRVKTKPILDANGMKREYMIRHTWTP